MPHPSPDDDKNHSTITGEGDDGKEVFRKHVPSDPNPNTVRAYACFTRVMSDSLPVAHSSMDTSMQN